jgi:oligoendopeptidase F
MENKIPTARKKRIFVSEKFQLKDWGSVEPYFEQLLNMELNDVEALKTWLRKRSELESIISEDAAWRYIRMTCDTTVQAHQDAYTFFNSELQPKIAPLSHQLNEKLLQCRFKYEMRHPAYKILFREIEKESQIFRQANIALKTEIQNTAKEYGSIAGAMSVTIDGKEMTLPQAARLLESPLREKREGAYVAIAERRLVDQEDLDNLFDKLLSLRHRVAQNADFDNFRDYMFTAMGRFDYEPQDCFDFHESVKYEVVPMLHQLAEERRNQMQLDVLKPWDKAVDPAGRKPLTPFEGSEDLVEKTIACFSRLHPFLGDCIRTMQRINHLDLDSRKGKAPGGYNYPLAELGIPFIFMNAVGSVRDMVTILHEGGHAVHSILTKDLELADFKHTPSEVAELASMSMELISMDHWDVFFDNGEDLRRAKKEHLEQIIQTLSWVAVIDSFQHWVYEHPTHSAEQRKGKWGEILSGYSDTITDWTGQERYRDYLWQKQLHLYEVPFYYIEYGFAQLGAIAIWKNVKENPQKGLEDYLNALRLGYTRSIPEIYQRANIAFDFSREYIGQLMDFLKKELAAT